MIEVALIVDAARRQACALIEGQQSAQVRKIDFAFAEWGADDNDSIGGGGRSARLECTWTIGNFESQASARLQPVGNCQPHRATRPPRNQVPVVVQKEHSGQDGVAALIFHGDDDLVAKRHDLALRDGLSCLAGREAATPASRIVIKTTIFYGDGKIACGGC